MERAALTSDTAERVRLAAVEALAVLAEQGAVARTEVMVEVRQDQGFLGLVVRHFDAAGVAVYDQRFGVLWRQEARAAPMNFGDQGVFA